MKPFVAALAALSLVLLGPPRLDAEEAGARAVAGDRIDFYGYAVNYSNINAYAPPGKTDSGNILYLRLKGDFRPQDSLFFHIEATYEADTGNQNPFVLARGYGLAAADSPSSVQELRIDHAWGAASLGAFALQFGKLPIGWGSAYVFNPTQRTAPSSLLNPVSDETPGTLAILPTWSPYDEVGLSGYLAFQDRSHRESVAAGDGDWRNLPLGLKLQTVLGNFDASVCLVKEVVFRESSSSYERSWFAGVDGAGAIGDFGVYAEAALKLPTGESGGSWKPRGFDLDTALEVAAGFDYSFSELDLELRVEYYHQGGGTSDSDRYDLLSALSGERPVQAKDYLFARAEKTFVDYVKGSLGGLANLNDRSLVGIVEAAYEACGNLELKLGARFPWGHRGSEFDGRYELGSRAFDILPASVYASCKLSF